VAEAEVLPHHDPDRMQPVHQDLLDELLRAELRQLESEGQHEHRIDTDGFEQVRTVVRRGQQRRMGTRPDHLGGMRIERDGDGRRAALARQFDRPPHHAAVTLVDSVEEADRHYAAARRAPSRRHLGQAVPALHRP
jgi:hypothetical protein